MEIFVETVGQYKSTWYETARNLFRSRNTQRAIAERHTQQAEELRLENEQLRRKLRESEERHDQTQQMLLQEQQENEQLRKQPIQLPADLPLPNHTYGPRMMALCMNLSKHIGLRPTETALRIVFKWLGIDAKIPSFSSTRIWMCRAGIAQLQMPMVGDDVIWFSDHSNQIGQEKILQIIAIRASDLPQPGETLSLDKMRVLATIPGISWTQDDVRREYKKLAARIGMPKYVVTDGASELRESVDVLGNKEKKPILLRDLKHFAANVFEKLIGKDERFQSYLSKLGKTRSQVQQTELGHFTPASQKPKARFMNLGPSLRWGKMVSYHLSHHRSQSRQGITAERMNSKLGWVRQYRDDLAVWNRCEEVMQASLSFINRQGVYRGAAAALEVALNAARKAHPADCDLSATMASELITFVRESELQLAAGDRAWLSTENLESLFGRYKRLEGQHSKGGFTSLVAALPTLTIDWNADLVRASLSAVSVKQMNEWVSENLGTTLTSRRATAYKEAKPKSIV